MGPYKRSFPPAGHKDDLNPDEPVFEAMGVTGVGPEVTGVTGVGPEDRIRVTQVKVCQAARRGA